MNYSRTLKFNSLVFILLFCFIAGSTQQIPVESEPGWGQVKSILAGIKAPKFPGKNFSIIKYGAKGDGVTDCTQAFKNAIEACNQAGGGRVVVPKGVFLTGAIHLKSNVNL